MMMLGPIWLVLVALCGVGLVMMHSDSQCERGHGKERARGECCGGGGLWKLILLVVGALLMIRFFRILPMSMTLVGELLAIAIVAGVVLMFARTSAATRRKMVMGGLVVAVGLVVGTVGLVTVSHGGDTIEIHAEDSASMDSVHVHPEHDEVVEHGEHSYLTWEANLDKVIAKLEQSKGHPPIARLLTEMRQLKASLIHLDAQMSDPMARRAMSEKLSKAMAALAESVDVLQRMDPHELTDQVRDEIDRWDDLLADAGDGELEFEVPIAPVTPRPTAQYIQGKIGPSPMTIEYPIILAVIGILTAVVLYVSSGTRRKLLIGIVGVLAAALVVGSLTLIPIEHGESHSISHIESAGNVTAQHWPDNHEHDGGRPQPESVDLNRNAAWRPEAEAAFEADIYSSIDTAGRALGSAIGALIDGALPADRSSPGTIEIGGRATVVEPDLGYALASVLRERFADAKVVVAAGELPMATPVGEGDARVMVDHKVDTNIVRGSAIIRATVITSDGEWLRTTRYIDKPWLAGFDAYVSARPGQSLFLARSALAHTREEAANQAVADAVAQVKPMVMDYLAQHSSIARESGWRQWADGWLNDHLANSVREGWIVADRFAQRLVFPTAGGDQWREAILIRVEPENLSALEGFARAQFHADQKLYQQRTVMQRRETMTEGAAVVGLVVLLLGVYVFLQLSTRGYYKWTVRLTMLVLIVVALAGVYRMSSHSPHMDRGSFVPGHAEFGSPNSH